MIASSAFVTATAPFFASTQIMAQAIQERNEALCSTGFFTNVGAWYCTDIGNIGDEGKSKDLSVEAMSTVDSLMSKFDMKDGDFSSYDDGGTDKGNNQRWIVKQWAPDNNYYRLIVKHANKCLDVPGGSNDENKFMDLNRFNKWFLDVVYKGILNR
jgi:hypothetical protein